MCFSAEASFAAAAILAVAGAVAVASVRRSSSRRLLPLALTPFLFALQQFAEGVVWIGANQGQLDGAVSQIAMVLFLFFAIAFWPVWIPFVFFFAERQPRRRLVLGWLGVAGMVIAGLNLSNVLHGPIAADALQCSLNYHIEVHLLTPFLYAVATILPFFASSLRGAPWLGGVIILGAIAAATFYWVSFISVWCFFAALIALGIIALVRRPENS